MSTFKKQEFRVLPKDVNAREGSNVTLSCEINDITGDVQWTKDGLALGKWIALYNIKCYTVTIFVLTGFYCIKYICMEKMDLEKSRKITDPIFPE